MKLRKEAVVEKLVGGCIFTDVVPELSNTIKVRGLKSASFTYRSFKVTRISSSGSAVRNKRNKIRNIKISKTVQTFVK